MIYITRLICIASIVGYILGIIIGLYFKSIALYVCFVVLISIFFFKKYKKEITVLFIMLIISLIYITILDNSYNNLKESNIDSYAIVVSDCEEKDYTYKYEARLIDNNKKVLMYCNKNKQKEKLRYGDLIHINGEIKKSDTERNYMGFNYMMYLRTKGIYGIVNSEKIEIIKRGYKKSIVNNLQKYIKKNIKGNLREGEANLLIGILIGDKSNLSDNIIEDFRNSSLSHILAVSGLHISYVIAIISFIIKKSRIGKLKGRYITIFILLTFISISNFTPSVMRAVIMANLTIISSILHRKSDTFINMFFSALIILILNPYSLFDLGFQLSFTRNLRNSSN